MSISKAILRSVKYFMDMLFNFLCKDMSKMNIQSDTFMQNIDSSIMLCFLLHFYSLYFYHKCKWYNVSSWQNLYEQFYNTTIFFCFDSSFENFISLETRVSTCNKIWVATFGFIVYPKNVTFAVMIQCHVARRHSLGR